MHNIINFMRIEGKTLSQSLRIAADMIEDNNLNNDPETVWQVQSVFRKLNVIQQKDKKQNLYKSMNRYGRKQ